MAKIPSSAMELFDQLTASINENPIGAKEINAKIGFDIEGAGEWVFDLTVSPAVVTKGTLVETAGCTKSAQCVVKMTHADLKTFLGDPSKGMALYFDGKLKITGDINAAGKIQHLFALLKP